MPPRLNFHSASRSLIIRSRPIVAPRNPASFNITPAACRCFGERGQPSRYGSNIDYLKDIGRGRSVDLRDTTPSDARLRPDIRAMIKRVEEQRKAKCPKDIEKDDDDSALALDITRANLIGLDRLGKLEGHKFGPPVLPFDAKNNLRNRDDAIVSQFTNMLMRDGKKSVAQRNMSFLLMHLRTASPPTVNPAKPLLPGSPPPSHLPLNPVLYLTTAVDSVAPLLRIRSQRGAAGGGASLQIPIPLNLRQRRRQAIKWILASAENKPAKGSGRNTFAQKVAEEIISVVEGKSMIWDKRLLVHRTATSARTNLNYFSRRRRR